LHSDVVPPATDRGAKLVAASVTLLAGVIGIGLQLPWALGWLMAAAGGVWLLIGLLRRS
jgi:hypothetical protein